MSAEELGELAKVVALVAVLVSTLLVPPAHTCVVVLVVRLSGFSGLGSGVREGLGMLKSGTNG